MTIRLATVADAEALTKLGAMTANETFGPPWNPADVVENYIQTDFTVPVLVRELQDTKATFFVVEGAENELIGYAKLRRCPPPRQLRVRPAIEIQRIYLLRRAIGQGVGRKLMEYCLTFAQEQGYKAVWLGVWERNESALLFYAHLGFAQIGWHYFQFGPERQRDFWLQKLL